MPDTGWWMMKDKQQAQCMFDRFGAEIYEGEEYFAGNDGDISDAT